MVTPRIPPTDIDAALYGDDVTTATQVSPAPTAQDATFAAIAASLGWNQLFPGSPMTKAVWTSLGGIEGITALIQQAQLRQQQQQPLGGIQIERVGDREFIRRPDGSVQVLPPQDPATLRTRANQRALQAFEQGDIQGAISWSNFAERPSSIEAFQAITQAMRNPDDAFLITSLARGAALAAPGQPVSPQQRVLANLVQQFEQATFPAPPQGAPVAAPPPRPPAVVRPVEEGGAGGFGRTELAPMVTAEGFPTPFAARPGGPVSQITGAPAAGPIQPTVIPQPQVGSTGFAPGTVSVGGQTFAVGAGVEQLFGVGPQGVPQQPIMQRLGLPGVTGQRFAQLGPQEQQQFRLIAQQQGLTPEQIQFEIAAATPFGGRRQRFAQAPARIERES